MDAMHRDSAVVLGVTEPVEMPNVMLPKDSNAKAAAELNYVRGFGYVQIIHVPCKWSPVILVFGIITPKCDTSLRDRCNSFAIVCLSVCIVCVFVTNLTA